MSAMQCSTCQRHVTDAKQREWLDWMIDELRRLVYAAKGGAFLLFTSNRALTYAARILRPEFEAARLNVYVQGELPKLEIAARFRVKPMPCCSPPSHSSGREHRRRRAAPGRRG